MKLFLFYSCGMIHVLITMDNIVLSVIYYEPCMLFNISSSTICSDIKQNSPIQQEPHSWVGGGGGGCINSYKVTKTADEYDNQNAEKHISKVVVFKTQLGPLPETSQVAHVCHLWSTLPPPSSYTNYTLWSLNCLCSIIIYLFKMP